LIGQRWQVSHVIGSGDLGEVYETYDVERSGVCAVKVLEPRILSNREIWSTYVRAARRSSELLGATGARITAIEVDGSSGCPFVVSEKLGERPLDAVVQSSGPLKPERVLALLCHLAPVLDALHAAGLAHGNLKPTNVFLTDAGEPRLTDFGLSALRDDRWAGPAGWCAPELFEAGARPTAQSDVYALGLITFFALTGRHAFAAADPLDRERLMTAEKGGLRTASARAAALGRKVDLRLDRWFLLALEPKLTQRFKTVSELARSFGQQLGLPVNLPEPVSVPAPEVDHGAAASDAAMAVQPQIPRAPSKPDLGGGKAADTSATPPNVAPRPMVVLEPTPPPGAVSRDSGIVSVSVKPLLFAEDIPRPPASSAPDLTQKPSAAAPTGKIDELGATVAVPSSDQVGEAEKPVPAALAAPADEEPPSAEVESPPRVVPARAADDQVDATPFEVEAKRPIATAQAAPSPTGAAPTAPESTPAPNSVAVSHSVLIAGGMVVLGMGLAMLALVLWTLSDRKESQSARAEAPPTAPAPTASALAGPAPTEAPAPAQAAPSAAPTAGQTAPAPTPAATDDPSAPPTADEPAPPSAGMGSVSFVCSPVPCESVFCDAQRYDPSTPIELKPGKHVCKAIASGYSAPGVTLHLAEGQHMSQTIELAARKEPATTKSGKKKPCGTFINPCK
jgi:serine/threonine-protein kinase